MSAQLIDGKSIASALQISQAERVEQLKKCGIVPMLSVVLVGHDPASAVYVRNKAKACEKVGIQSETIEVPEDTTQEQLEDLLDRLSNEKRVHGILLQLPLPKGFDQEKALRHIAPSKDVDGFLPENSGALMRGGKGFVPCTPKGILYLLKKNNIPMDGAHAVIIGRSSLVGKPMAMLLLNENCTVTICHSHTQNLPEITRTADILVAAVGKPHMITAEMIKPGAAVIDVGINRTENGITGDVDFASVREVAGFITPVPGGVGPMTVSMLLENTLEAACGA